jgi:F-type H+-transporting ATPase subunit gamma
MSKLTEVRERIRAVENIGRITRTLATVAAARLSRARRRAAGMREYSERFRQVLFRQQAHLSRVGLEITRQSDLLRPRARVRNVAILLITADRGMCGGYNLEAFRVASDLWEKRRKAGQGVRFIAVGRKGARFLERRRANIVHRENWRREGISADVVEHLLGLLLHLYRSGQVDEVHAVYTQFHTALHREARERSLLPVVLERGRPPAALEADRWHYEPAFQDVVEELVTVYLRVQLFGVLLESHASEQGARMITMEEATERADRSLQGYRVQHNRMRRELITSDLLGALFASKAIEESSSTRPRQP